MSDAPLLEVLVAYEQATVYAYDITLANAQLDGSDRRTLERLRGQTQEAAAALAGVLEREGGTAPPQTSRSPKGDPGTATREDFLEGVLAAEERTVGGYYVALQSIQKKKLLAGTAAFMAQTGRRLVVVRDLAGKPALPRAFETGGL
jgi:hypothetical protein